jgi:hypothetical protein
VPVQIEQQGSVVEVRIGQSNGVIWLSMTGNLENFRTANAESVWLVFALTFTGPDYTPEQAEADNNSAAAVFKAVFSNLTDEVDMERWGERNFAERGRVKDGFFAGAAGTLNDIRFAIYPGAPAFFVFDTFTECKLEGYITHARYREMKAADICPELPY